MRVMTVVPVLSTWVRNEGCIVRAFIRKRHSNKQQTLSYNIHCILHNKRIFHEQNPTNNLVKPLNPTFFVSNSLIFDLVSYKAVACYYVNTEHCADHLTFPYQVRVL